MTDPANPSLEWSVPVDALPVDVVGNLAYAVQGDLLLVIDLGCSAPTL